MNGTQHQFEARSFTVQVVIVCDISKNVSVSSRFRKKKSRLHPCEKCCEFERTGRHFTRRFSSDWLYCGQREHVCLRTLYWVTVY